MIFRVFRRLLLWMLVIITLLSLLCAGVYVYQNKHGLPKWMVQKMVEPLRKQGVDVEFTSLKIGSDARVIGEDVLLTRRGDSEPFLAGNLSVGLSFEKVLNAEMPFEHVQIQDGTLHFDAASWGLVPAKGNVYHLEEVHAELGILENALQLEAISFNFAEMKVSASGLVSGSDALKRIRNRAASSDANEVSPNSTLSDDQVARNKKKVQDLFLSVATVYDEISSYRYTESPHLDVHFDVNLDVPDLNRFEIRGGIDAPARIRGVNFDRARFVSEWKNQTLWIRESLLEHHTDRVSFTGAVDLVSRELKGVAEMDAPFLLVEQFLPVNLVDYLSDLGVFCPGRIKAKVQIPRQSLADASKHWVADINIDALQFRDVEMNAISGQITMSGDELIITNLLSEVGHDWRKGEAEVAFQVNLATRYFSAMTKCNFDPVLLSRVLPKQEHIFRAIDYFDAPPSIDLRFSAQEGVAGSTRLHGKIKATNVVYNSTMLDRLSLTLDLTNRVTSLTNIIIERDGDDAYGTVILPPNKTVLLDINSTMPPKALARIGGPSVEQALQSFRFNGDNHLEIKGLIDVGPERNHSIYGAFYLEDSGYVPVMPDDIYFRWHYTGKQLSFFDMRGHIYDGVFSGSVMISNLMPNAEARFASYTFIEGMDLKRILSEASRKGSNQKVEGIVSGRLELNGIMNHKLRESLTGKGFLRVEDGKLFQIALLGGLSKILSTVYKGFGYASQTELFADFKIVDERVSSLKLELKGDFMTIKGRGYTTFDKDLNYAVQASLLKDGLIGELVRLVTSPVTFLLEVRLRGTVDKPDWRPENLPKELFLKFD